MSSASQTSPLRNLFRFLILLIIVIYLALISYLWHQALEKTHDDLNYVNSFLVKAVQSTLKDHELILRGMGTELVSDGALLDPEKGRALIERMNNIDPGMVGFGLARPDGQLVLVSGLKKGSPLPNLVNNPLSKKSFADAISSGHLRMGRAYYFKPLGDWVVPIRVPIYDNKGGLVAVMTAGYAIANATTAWSNVSLLPGIKVALLANDGYPRYLQPLPAGPREQVLKDVFETPVADTTIGKIRSLKDRHAYFELDIPRSGGMNYVMYTGIPEYGLHTGAFIARSFVIKHWLQQLLIPSALMFLILISGVFVYSNTLNQQSMSNRAISQLSAWQQAVLDGADYSIISTDVNGKIVSFNKTAERLLGYRADEMIGKQTPEIIHDVDEVRQRASELSAEIGSRVEPGFDVFVAKARMGQVEEREWTYIRKDGTRFPVRLSVTPLTTSDGAIIGFMGIADDLSQQKIIQATLRDSVARYKTLFEHAGDAIFMMQDERFIDCNPATLKMFGCTRDQIVGETPIRFSPEYQPDGRASRDKAIEKINAAYAGRTQSFEWRHIRYDGTPFDAEVTLNVMYIGGDPHLLATVRDVSARKQSENDLRLSRQALIKHNENLRLINLVSNRLHGTLNLDDILHETMQALLGMSNTPNIAIYLLHPEDQQTLTLAAHHGFPSELIKTGAVLPVGESLSGLALFKARVLVTTEIVNDPRLNPGVRKGLTAIGANTGIVIPLFYQKQPLGSINLVYDTAHIFDQSEKETLASLGNTVALAIANARHIENLAYQARHDSLTQLPNRIMLHESIKRHLDTHNKADTPVSLMLLDLDRFKEINDTLGHQIGDRVLAMVGERIQAFCADTGAITSRLGGDEFAIALLENGSPGNTRMLAEQIRRTLQEPFLVEGIELSLGASIGIAYLPRDGNDSHDLLRAADVAMYHAKKRGSGITEYDSHFDDYSTERLTLAHELAQAVSQNQLVLHYQPKFDLATSAVTGFEALVRWQHPRLGLLLPDSFIHLAEVSEVIHPFTRKIMEQAVSDKQKLHALGFHQPVAINLSAINLGDSRFLGSLQAAIKEHGLEAGEIELELTETALMHEGDNALKLLNRFNNMGINIAIDDFGTGYSSLSYLRRLPIKSLKIDRSFVVDMRHNQQDSKIVRSTIDLAHNLDLLVVAEGVEDDETMAMLREMGCDQAQGYNYCRPRPYSELIDWLTQSKRATGS